MSTICDTINKEIGALMDEIKGLQEDLQGEAGSQKLFILQQIKKAQQELATKKAEFAKKCQSPPQPVPLKPVRIHVSEIFCFQESGEADFADEPYLLVLSVDLTATIVVNGVTIPFPAQ